MRRPPRSTPFPYTTLFRSERFVGKDVDAAREPARGTGHPGERARGEHIGSPVARRPHAERYRSEEHTSELQSRVDLVCRLLLEKKKKRGVWGARRMSKPKC